MVLAPFAWLVAHHRRSAPPAQSRRGSAALRRCGGDGKLLAEAVEQDGNCGA
jgi:hypothetical protein